MGKPTRGGFGGVNDFAFRQKDENADVEIFRPFGSCRTQWAEPETMGVDTAIVINEDLHSGTSMPSKVFNTNSSPSRNWSAGVSDIGDSSCLMCFPDVGAT